MGAHDELIENLTFDELHAGQQAQAVRTLTMADIQAFALVSGDVKPAHMPWATTPKARASTASSPTACGPAR